MRVDHRTDDPVIAQAAVSAARAGLLAASRAYVVAAASSVARKRDAPTER